MIYRLLTYFLVLIFLFGCANKEIYPITKINLSTFTGLSINANRVLVENNYNNKIEYPFIDHLIEYNIKYYLDEWIASRIISNYESENTIKISIEKANVKAFSLDNNNIEDIFKNKAAARIEIDVFVIIEIVDANDNNLAYLDLKVFKSKELSENISLNEKDYFIQKMINETIIDFDKLAIGKIKEVFLNYIKV